MPKASNYSALARQWAMLNAIPSRQPGITASDLTQYLTDEGYTVCKRTVERDLNALSGIFGLACNDISIPHGWYWVNAQRHRFESVELTDAASMTLAAQVLRRALPSSMVQALEYRLGFARKKLAKLDHNKFSHLPEKVRYLPDSPIMLPPKVKPAILETVYDALLNERQIEVTYAPFQSDEKNYTLHPLYLILKGHTPYLAATAFDFKDIRLYALHRVRKASATDASASLPDNFSIDDYLQSGAMAFGSNKIITLKARLSEELASYLDETPLCEGQKVQCKNDVWQITAKVRDSWQLQFWILSQGGGITVLSPKNLRERIKDELEGALEGYS